MGLYGMPWVLACYRVIAMVLGIVSVVMLWCYRVMGGVRGTGRQADEDWCAVTSDQLVFVFRVLGGRGRGGPVYTGWRRIGT